MAATHAGLQKLLPLGPQVELDTPPGSGEGGTANEQDEKHHIGEGSRDPHHLPGQHRNAQLDTNSHPHMFCWSANVQRHLLHWSSL